MPSLIIVFTTKADKDEINIYQYISKIFGKAYADKFRKKLIELLRLIAIQPYIGRTTKNDRSLRVITISKQNKIIYKVTEENIIIIRILNTKTDISERF